MMHLCSFTSLDELPKKDRGDPVKVLRALERAGRFSCFDIEGKLCDTVTWLLNDSGWVKDAGGGYPWTNIEITEAGHAKLKEGNQ